VVFSCANLTSYRAFSVSRRRELCIGLKTRDGKEPSLLEFCSVRVLPNIKVRSVLVLSSYGKMKVRFWFGSLCRVFGSVRFGCMWVLRLHVYNLHRIHNVSQKNPPEVFSHFSRNGWEFLVKILLAYYLSYTLDYNNFIQLSPTVMKSCHIKCDHPACVSADGGHFEHMM